MYDTLCKQQLLKTNCLCLQKFLSLLRKINQTASLHKIQITIINFQNKQANVAVRKQRIYNVVEISLLQRERPSGQGIELPIQTFPVANHRVPPPTQVNPLSLAGQQSQHQGFLLAYGNPEAYWEPCQTSKVECIAKVVIDSLSIFAKRSI